MTENSSKQRATVAQQNPRNLPEDIYGHFDVRQLPDGNKQYALPHTLAGTVLAWTTTPLAFLGVLGISAVTVIAYQRDAQTLWDYGWRTLLVFCVLHLALFVAVLLWALVSGARAVTLITMRPDGLVLNNHYFYPAEHILSVSFGTDHKWKTGEHLFVPKLEIDFGTRRLVIAENIELEAANLFERLFRDDMRRYWHKHN